jgi:hypothetical protein
MPADYDENAIRTLTPDEVVGRFDFALKHRLATEYPAISPLFIGRLVDACRMADYPVADAVRRYLAKETDAPPPSPELLAVFAENRR